MEGGMQAVFMTCCFRYLASDHRLEMAFEAATGVLRSRCMEHSYTSPPTFP